MVGTIQMYLQDAIAQLEHELADAKKHDYQLALELDRGAYTHSEPDRWNVIHKTKADTDASYNKGISMMLDSIIDGWKNPGKGPLSNGLPLVGRVVVASHNEESMSIVDRRLKEEVPHGTVDLAKEESIVFGQLMGMAEDPGVALAMRGHKVIKYVPWGPTKETKDAWCVALKDTVTPSVLAAGNLSSMVLVSLHNTLRTRRTKKKKEKKKPPSKRKSS